MKVIATADLHGTLPDIPPCDLLLLGGDLLPISNHQLDFQAQWVEQTLTPRLEGLPAAQTVAIGGNHDFLFQQQPHIPRSLPWYYADDRLVEILGLRIWGHPWIPQLHRWAFYAPEPELAERVACIPPCDLLLSHGPPRGQGDRIRDGRSVGCSALARHLQGQQIGQVICGHIHDDQGSHPGKVPVHNVAYMDHRYQPGYPPQPLQL